VELAAETLWHCSRPDLLRPGRSISYNESPLDRAVRDLAKDWRAVFGANPTTLARGPSPSRLAIGRDAVQTLRGDLRDLAPEQWAIEVSEVDGGGQAVCLYGGDVRGDVYAVYQFSHLFLGIDKFYHWRDTSPSRRDRIEVSSVSSQPPVFEWRGWFLNDEDLLTGWAPDPEGSTGISLDVWDRVYETLLRCGGNFVVPGTFVFPDEPQVKLASARGLAIGQHHIEVVGLNTFRWDDNVEYSFVDDPETMIDAWRTAVEQYEGREVVWSVGYRGRHDRPFWRDDEGVGASAAARGKVITDAIQAQVDIIREARPNDTIVHHLWMEGVELYEQGTLSLPPDVSVVWPDDGFGFVRDGGRVGRGEGAYYHVAMYNRFANQLTEAVPVERISAELNRLAAAGATTHVVVNVSDLRPCLLTTEAVMDFLWTLPTGDEAAGYLEGWANRLHGDSLGRQLAELWGRYFEIGWRPTDDRPHRLEDTGYHTFARMLLAEMAGGPAFDFEESRLPELVPDDAVYRPFRRATTTRQAADLLAEGTASAREDWRCLADDVEELIGQLDPNNRALVMTHLGVQARFHAEANDMLHEVASAFTATQEGPPDAWRIHIAAAEQSLDSQRAALADAEIGRWRGWYSGDLFVDVSFTYRLVRRLLDDGVLAELDPMPGPAQDRDLHVLRFRDIYGAIKAYQGDRRVGRTTASTGGEQT
jgi:hypothetical protein